MHRRAPSLPVESGIYTCSSQPPQGESEHAWNCNNEKASIIDSTCSMVGAPYSPSLDATLCGASIRPATLFDQRIGQRE
eukprot:2479782-Pyramimonas_sp.AAC.1